MSIIVKSNLPDLFDRDGHVVGCALPDMPPATVVIVWSKGLRHGEDTEEYVYRAEWLDGAWAEAFTMPAGWAEVHRETMVASSRAKLAGVDRALRRTAA